MERMQFLQGWVFVRQKPPERADCESSQTQRYFLNLALQFPQISHRPNLRKSIPKYANHVRSAGA